MAEIQIIPIANENANFDGLVELTLRSLDSANSQRVYRQTFNAWRDYCAANGLDAGAISPRAVLAFLAAGNTSKATRQRQLSAFRKLAQVVYVLYPDEEARRIYEGLKLVKSPAPEIVERSERPKRALSPSQADKLLRAWNVLEEKDDAELPLLRNRALIAVLLLSGVRRSEAAALTWEDVDFEHGVLTIRHGKGDKIRQVPLAGEFALETLSAWRQAQGSGRQYIFSPVERGGHLGADRPLSGTDVYRIVKATEDMTGIAFKPHDCRRTFITESITIGVPMHEVQANAGHARGDTTLGYAQTVNARERRKNLRLRYG